MKKIITLLCLIACVCSFTACGSVEVEDAYQTEKTAFAEQNVVGNLMSLMEQVAADENLIALYEAGSYTAEEWEYEISNATQIQIDGNAFIKGLDSYIASVQEIGGIVEIGNVTSQIDDGTIILIAEVIGETKNAEAEIIVSNDFFMKMQSFTLNVEQTMEEKMTNAALNTVLGMGTVFAVLVFIMCIISAFAIIPKIQNKLKNKGGNDTGKKSNSGNDLELVAAIAAATAYEESKNDTELVAVISAAIAAYRGEANSDGFVVRSIKKIRRR